jgi:hypothetical protein
MSDRIRPEDAVCAYGTAWLNHWPEPLGNGPGCSSCQARGVVIYEKFTRAELKAIELLKQDNSERPPQRKRVVKKREEPVALGAR